MKKNNSAPRGARLRTLLAGAAVMVMAAGCTGASLEDLLTLPTPTPSPTPSPTSQPTPATATLSHLSTYDTGVFGESAAEIVAFDKDNDNLYVINAAAVTVDVISIADPTSPVKTNSIDASALGGSANSVSVHDGVVAVAIEAVVKQDPGVVAFYDASTLNLLGSVTVGALPDMLTFTPDGAHVLVANEGEPNDDYTVDPVGSISVIDMSNGAAAATVATASFDAFVGQEAALRAEGVRIFGPNATAAQDFEPEYIAVSADSAKAWVALQENNAFALVDIATATVTDVVALGTKDHSLAENVLDASDRDGAITFANYPVHGFFMPDGIASFTINGVTYIATANEGDSRDYGGYSEEVRVKDLTLDATVFPNAADLQANETLGRLKTTTANGDTDDDGDVDVIYSYGARSMSIFSAEGVLISDTADTIEQVTAELLPNDFNSTNDENGTFDGRSDDKGPEPEGIDTGVIGDRTFAFVGLERVGGVMVFDVTDPTAPAYQSYINNRNFSVDAQDTLGGSNAAAGDLGPEGVLFIPAADSPNGKDLVVTGSEVSGTTSVFEVIVE